MKTKTSEPHYNLYWDTFHKETYIGSGNLEQIKQLAIDYAEKNNINTNIDWSDYAEHAVVGFQSDHEYAYPRFLAYDSTHLPRW